MLIKDSKKTKVLNNIEDLLLADPIKISNKVYLKKESRKIGDGPFFLDEFSLILNLNGNDVPYGLITIESLMQDLNNPKSAIIPDKALLNILTQLTYVKNFMIEFKNIMPQFVYNGNLIDFYNLKNVNFEYYNTKEIYEHERAVMKKARKESILYENNPFISFKGNGLYNRLAETLAYENGTNIC